MLFLKTIYDIIFVIIHTWQLFKIAISRIDIIPATCGEYPELRRRSTVSRQKNWSNYRMYEIKFDLANNRLTIILGGTIGKVEGERIGRELVHALNQLKRGFDVITDFSGYTSSDIKNDDILKRSIEFIKLRGVRKVVRVVGGSKEGLVKFAQITQSIEKYDVKYVTTRIAAEEFLDSL